MTIRRLLLERGHRVAVTGRKPDKLQAFLTEAGRPKELMSVVADAADWEATQAAVAQTVEHFGGLDAAIANAGFTSADCFRTGGATISHGDGDPTLWPAMVLTNVLGPALLARAALPHLREHQGRLVLIGSVAGLKNARHPHRPTDRTAHLTTSRCMCWRPPGLVMAGRSRDSMSHIGKALVC
ncbi:SDR family oxidoreductase [Streptomyces sp. KR55]|uniref:SDR family oxidoreductase n=1 Tax=Streptomyces sp. KR55 TaxID=3457425 RepID=UPI003FD3BBA6